MCFSIFSLNHIFFCLSHHGTVSRARFPVPDDDGCKLFTSLVHCASHSTLQLDPNPREIGKMILQHCWRICLRRSRIFLPIAWKAWLTQQQWQDISLRIEEACAHFVCLPPFLPANFKEQAGRSQGFHTHVFDPRVIHKVRRLIRGRERPVGHQTRNWEWKFYKRKLGAKLVFPPILVVNYDSSCVSFFLSACTVATYFFTAPTCVTLL